MPSSATITAFVTMVAGTKARASHVNANFNNFRGHILPVDPNTAASAHNTYDLGASDAYWRRIYVSEAPFINGAQTSKFEVETIYDGSNPCDVVEDIAWLGRAAYPKLTATSARFQFKVPSDYSSGNRISLQLTGFCETGGSHITLESVSALYRPAALSDNGSLTSPANVLTSTSNVNPPTTAGFVFQNTSLRLTDATGKINSLTVTSGDLIAVDLKRVGTATADTNAGYFYLTNIVVDLNN